MASVGVGISKNKIFYFRIALFIFLIFVGHLFFNYVLAPGLWHTANQKLRYNLKVVKKEIDVGLIETVILGDSSGVMSLNPKLIGSSVNLSLMASTPGEAKLLLERYVEGYGVPKNVVLSFSFNSNYFEKSFWRQYVATGFYNLKSSWPIVKEFQVSQGFFDRQLALGSFVKKYILAKLDLDEEARRRRFGLVKKAFYSESLGQVYSEIVGWNKSTERKLIEQKGYLHTKGKRSDEMSLFSYLYEDFAPPHYYLEKYEELLEYCHKNEIDVFTVSSPIHEDLKGSDFSFYRGMGAYFRRLQNRYPEFYFDSNVEAYPAERMFDGNHLSRAGADIFSREVAKLLSEK